MKRNFGKPSRLGMCKIIGIAVLAAFSCFSGYAASADELASAAFEGQTAVVKRLISQGVDINAKNQQGFTALMCAANKRHPEIVKILLDAGADINIKTNKGYTVLNFEMDNQSRALIEEKAKEGNIVLAASNGKTDLVRRLIAEGKDVNAKDKDKDGNTALIEAAEQGHIEVVKLLISAKADLHAKNKIGGTALHFAANKGHAEVVKLLISAKADVNARDKNGWTPLRAAAYGGRTEVVKVLLAAKADVNARDKDGNTALMYAAEDGNRPEIVKILLDAGADINIKNNKGYTVLDYKMDDKSRALIKDGNILLAASNGKTDLVRRLIAEGKDVNAKNKNGNTALMYAAYLGNAEIVKLLINAKADINAKNEDGMTALMLAAMQKHPEVVKVLLDAGADVNSDRVNTILRLCDDKSKDLIEEKASEGNIFRAALNGKADLIKKMIAQGTDVNAKNEDGWTPLLLAASKGHTKAVELLINAKADVNAKNKDGETALCLAAWAGDKWAVRLLIDAKSDVYARSKYGTALKSAEKKEHAEIVKLLTDAMTAEAEIRKELISASTIGITELVKSLIAQGKDVNAKDKDGWTALMCAANNNHPEIVKILLDAGADINISNNEGHDVSYYKMDDRSSALIKEKKEEAKRNFKLKAIIAGGIPSGEDAQWKYADALIQLHENQKFKEFIEDDKCELDWYDSMFSEAAKYGSLDIAKLLWPLLSPKNDFRDDYFAVMARGDKEFFNYLIAQKAPFDWKNYGAEAAVFAAAGGSVEIMDALKRHQAPLDNVVYTERFDLPSSPYHNGNMAYHRYTALSVAAYKGNLKTVQYLVENGAQVNRVISGDGESQFPYDALMAAANGGETEVCLYLISKGANPNYISFTENSVLIAKRRGFTQCAEALIKAGGATSKLELRKLRNKQEAKAQEAEAAAQKARAAARAEARRKFLDSLKGVERAAAEVIIRNYDRAQEIASKTPFLSLTSGIERDVVKISLSKESMFGNTYRGYYILRVGGLDNQVQIRATYDGKKCIVKAYDTDGKGTNMTFE